MTVALPQAPDGHVWEISEHTLNVDRAAGYRTFRLELVQYTATEETTRTERRWWGGTREVRVPSAQQRHVKAHITLSGPVPPLPEDFAKAAAECLEHHARAVTAAWFTAAYAPRRTA